MTFQPASARNPVPDEDLQDAFKPVESRRDTCGDQTATGAKRQLLLSAPRINSLATPRTDVAHQPEKEVIAVDSDTLDPKIVWRLHGLADLIIDDYLDALRCNPH